VKSFSGLYPSQKFRILLDGGQSRLVRALMSFLEDMVDSLIIYKVLWNFKEVTDAIIVARVKSFAGWNL